MSDAGDLTAELYLRAFSTAADRQREVIARLDALAGDGVLESLAIERWGDRIDLADGNETVEAFRRFREWAAGRDLSITPPFAVRTYRSAFTGEACDVLVTPVMFLATYVDGELDGLYPHQRHETVMTIDDFLGTLESTDAIHSSRAEDTAVIR